MKIETPEQQIDALIAYETGELDEQGTIDLFQNLVDTGLAWKLQGSIGRAAKAMLDAGAIHLPDVRHRDYYGHTIPSRQDVEEQNEIAKRSRLGSREAL